LSQICRVSASELRAAAIALLNSKIPFLGEEGMAQRLALGVTPGTGWRAAEIRSIAQTAEAAGFEAIFAGEVNTDALATAQLMGEATTTIKVGTWVANNRGLQHRTKN
jgi:alkanesulfonate monooxygenase SsuD/methylene tetrahydromethanopterin reductase-like flavin-dependent oxidoreductase (luciferase family)